MPKQYQPNEDTLARQAARTKRMQEERAAVQESSVKIQELLEEQMDNDDAIAEEQAKAKAVEPGDEGVTQVSRKARRKAQREADSAKAEKMVQANIGRKMDGDAWTRPAVAPAWTPAKA